MNDSPVVIRPYPKNAKKHPQKQIDQLAAIVREVGWRQPILVNQQGVIVAGHGRWEVYQQNNDLPEAWVIDDAGNTILGAPASTPLTEEQERAYRLADNKLAETDVDMGLVLEELKELEALAPLTGYDMDLLIEPNEQDDEVPEPPTEPQSQVGDLYELGEHRVLCGDSTKIEDVERLMNGRKADMVFTDPPYGVSYQSNMRTKSEKFDVIENDETILTDWIAPAASYSTGWVFVWTTWRVVDQWLPLMHGFGPVTNMVVWYKGGGGIGDLRRTFSTDYEIALVCNRDAELKGKRIGSVWKLQKDHASSYVHPTQKPVELGVEAITKTTDGDALVLDMFLGSGSTLIAAQKTGRICYGMELDPKYVDVIVQRYVEYTGNATIKKNGQEITWKKNS
jgi:DNA modification methylase